MHSSAVSNGTIPLLSYDSYQCAMWYDEDDASTIAQFSAALLSTFIQGVFCAPVKHFPSPKFSLLRSAYFDWLYDSVENIMWTASLCTVLHTHRVKRPVPEFIAVLPKYYNIFTQGEFTVPPLSLSETSMRILDCADDANYSALVRSLYRLDYCAGPARRWRTSAPPYWYRRPGYRPRP